MNKPAHKTEEVNRIQTMRFHPFVFTSNAPRKGKRIPLNEINYNEQRDEETGYGYLPRQARQAHHGARYMDHELMTMWLSVDPLADKYPNISPYAYCAWNPVKLVDPDGRKIKGVTYNPQTGEYSYTKATRRVGVDRYIEARCRTVSGRKSVQRMISSPTKFRIRVIDKPIVLPDGNGKVNQLSGIVLRGNYILISTADKVTVDEGKSGFDAVYVDGRNIVEENFKVKVSDLVSNPDESEFEEAYRLTEMEEFEKQYPYQTEEQKIHGIGAHEETHALDNGSKADALNNEKKERLEYIKEVLQ